MKRYQLFIRPPNATDWQYADTWDGPETAWRAMNIARAQLPGCATKLIVPLTVIEAPVSLEGLL